MSAHLASSRPLVALTAARRAARALQSSLSRPGDRGGDGGASPIVSTVSSRCLHSLTRHDAHNDAGSERIPFGRLYGQQADATTSLGSFAPGTRARTRVVPASIHDFASCMRHRGRRTYAMTANPIPSASAPQETPLSSSPQVPPLPTVRLVSAPSEPEEPEVYEGDGEPSVILTERAVERLAAVSTREQNPNLALRIAVEPGGCHGYQYKMELADTADQEKDDFAFTASLSTESQPPSATLLVDSISLNLIKGSTIDFVTELIGSQFVIRNNPQAKGSGCGCGVSWEPKI